MKVRKTAVFLTLIVCILLACTACTPMPSDETGANETATGDGTEPTESAPETLVMATDATFPPYEFTEGQDIVGIDIEIAQKIANKLGLTLEIKSVGFNDIVSAVQNGQADIGMAALTADETRLASVDFSASYATGKQVIIVKDADIVTPADLAGKKIGVQQNTAGDTYCIEDFGEAAITRYSTGAEAIQALVQGSIDAVVIDSKPAKILVQENVDIEILDTEYKLDNYAIAIKKDSTSLLQKVNSALSELKASGEIQAIIDKYINAE